MFDRPLAHIGPKTLSKIPEYPTWSRWRREATITIEDWYYFTRYDGEVRVLNTEYGRERVIGHHIVFLCPLRKDHEGTWIDLTQPFSTRSYSSLEELVHYRDWVFTHLPTALMLGALS